MVFVSGKVGGLKKNYWSHIIFHFSVSILDQNKLEKGGTRQFQKNLIKNKLGRVAAISGTY